MQSVKNLITKMALKQKNSRPFTVIVEGNIGCGKTTFLEYFGKHKSICVLAEPVDIWRNADGHNLLGLMYEDPKKWSFTFQSYVQLTMLQNHLKPTTCPVKLIERSVYSARYCFVEKLTNDGLLAKPSSAVIDKWFQWIIEQNFAQVDLIVYLRTSPEIVYQRILQRKRPEEKTVSLSYLRALHQIHEDWLYHKTLFQCPAPTLILNANLEKSVIEQEYEKCESHILNLRHLEQVL
ncbi:unnamed protein product [Ceutorhynchus assimilis]|uniref:Deoxynucleoside kinase domain-containing protein n=1 Tax=Ceutorhynchus assimilis TaxID=467358 RepID=A0A9N9MJM0_9CUCU|nr:unnamed protein product [Ceutorhynchus assimilis]